MNQTMDYPLRGAIREGQDIYIDHSRQPMKKTRSYFHDKAESLKAYLQRMKQTHDEMTYRNRELRKQLRAAGLSNLDMLRSETFHLTDALFSDESIRAAVCGRAKDGNSILMLVTNLRIVCLNRIPLFTDMDEFAYSAVNGVSLDSGRFGSTIILYTAIGNFTVHTTNSTAARRFAEYTERAAIESQNPFGAALGKEKVRT